MIAQTMLERGLPKRARPPALPIDNFDYELTASDLHEIERLLNRMRIPEAREIHRKVKRVIQLTSLRAARVVGVRLGGFEVE